MSTTEATAGLHILRHSLGLDMYGLGVSYRNHYCSRPTCDSYPICQQLVERGLMFERHNPDGYSMFVVSEAGLAIARESK